MLVAQVALQRPQLGLASFRLTVSVRSRQADDQQKHSLPVFRCIMFTPTAKLMSGGAQVRAVSFPEQTEVLNMLKAKRTSLECHKSV